MADISMCHGGQCPSKEQCYRFRAVPNDMWQTFSNFTPNDSGKCDYFWSAEGYRVRTMEEINARSGT